eukprot:3151721-Karenia_brevis.AAC.1
MHEEVGHIKQHLQRHDMEIKQLQEESIKTTREVAEIRKRCEDLEVQKRAWEQQQLQFGKLLEAMQRRIDAIDMQAHTERNRIDGLEKGMANDEAASEARDFGWERDEDPTILRMNSEVHIAREDLLAALLERWGNALNEGDWHL